MPRLRSIGAPLLWLGLAAAPAAAAPPSPFRLFLNGVFEPSGNDFDESRSFTQYAETGTLDAAYSEKTGYGGELGLQYSIKPHLAVAAGVGLTHRDVSAHFDAEIPHPFYFGQFRQASGDLSGFGAKETAVTLDLVYTASSGRFDFRVFGGGAYFHLAADLIGDLQYTQTYPYDSVTVTGATTLSTSGDAFGFDVGAGADYRLSPHFALGAQARYARGTASLHATSGETLDVRAGGLQLAVGLRFIF